MAVDCRGRYAERTEERVIKRLGFLQVVGSDHHMRKHAIASQSRPGEVSRSCRNAEAKLLIKSVKRRRRGGCCRTGFLAAKHLPDLHLAGAFDLDDSD